MGTFLAYTIYSGIFLLFLNLFYQLFISKEKQIALNRGILLGCYAVALTAWPLSRMEWGSSATEGNVTDIIAMVGTLQPEMLLPQESSTSVIPQILMWIYLIGASVVLLHTLNSTVRLALYIRKGNAIRKDGYRIIVMPGTETAPFSIGRTIVMNEVDYATVREAVTAHELAHIRCRHYLDLVLAQAVCIVLWYNPAAWLMRDELKLLHEYQADEKVLEGGADPKEYQMLLIRKTVGSRMHILANNLNHSKLKHRIAMMQKEKSKGRKRLRIISLYLGLSIALGIVNNPAVAADLNTLADSRLSISRENDRIQVPEKNAEFPGGSEKLWEYLAMNLRYPESAMAENRTGHPVVAFTIEADGSVSDPKIARSAYPDLDEEAIRVVKKMPKWTPATTDGQPVASEFAVVVNFRIPGVEDAKSGADGNEDLGVGFEQVEVVGYGAVKKTATLKPRTSEKIIASEDNKDQELIVSTSSVNESSDISIKVVKLYPTVRVEPGESVKEGFYKSMMEEKRYPTVRVENGKSNKKVLNLNDKGAPTIFIDGVRFDGDLKVLDPKSIESVSVRKESPEYPNGVVDIKLKKSSEVYIHIQGDNAELVVGATPDENCDAKDNTNGINEIPLK